ncbi:hypothetical protein F4860DRAFT_475241 [Xylaria cubensis]|nr:hypothetical protein F4860DRAFT_475241 [Xylaria cubensis]
MALPDLPRLGSEATKHCDLQGSDLMPVLFFCKDDDQQTPRAMHWGRGKRRDLWRVWARYRKFGESDNGPASQATSTSMGSSPLPLDSCRQAGKSKTRYGAKSRPSAQWAVHPCALMDHQVAVVLVGMYDEGSWLGLGGRRACSNCVFPTRARGGFGTRAHTGCLFQTADQKTGFTVLAGSLGTSCRYRIAWWSPVFFSKSTPVRAEGGNTVLYPTPSTFAQSPQLGRQEDDADTVV